MENALLVGLSRQTSLRRELDVVANNLANLNTAGFKGDSALFAEQLIEGTQQGDFRRGDRGVSFVSDVATWHDMRSGPRQQTGNPLDIALEGDAFLAVETPGGERYTRNGALQINAQGELVNASGHRILGASGPIVFQPRDRDVNISRDGSITVAGGENRGKLRAVRFEQPQRLRKDGALNFAAPRGIDAQPVQTAVVHQGTLEGSNVQSVLEMTRMIEVTRSYSSVAGLLQNQADLRKSAIERLADVPA